MQIQAGDSVVLVTMTFSPEDSPSMGCQRSLTPAPRSNEVVSPSFAFSAPSTSVMENDSQVELEVHVTALKQNLHVMVPLLASTS